MQGTQETRVLSLGQEDPLQQTMATRSCILAWKIPWIEELSELHIIHGVTKTETQLSARARTQESIYLYYLSTCNTSMLLLSPFSRVQLCGHGLQTAKAPVSGQSQGKNTGVGCHALLQGDLPSKATEMGSPALQARFFTAEPLGKGSNTSISYLVYVIIFLTLAKKYATYNSCEIYSQKQR